MDNLAVEGGIQL